MLGDIRTCTIQPKTSGSKIRYVIKDLEQWLEPGDIVARGYDYFLDKYYLPGIFTHTGIIIKEINGDTKVIHSVAEGVSSCDIADFIQNTDRFTIMRPRYESGRNIDAVILAKQFLNHKASYDFFLDSLDANSVYCHELTARCLICAGLHIFTESLTFGFFPIRFKKELYTFDSISFVCDKIF